ncbi:MAG: histidine kinase dimerization/phosphoacceptor domain -containing protein [Candidatus Aminicenantes bacterium]|jgi:PAS domain S-box-containing protein
MSVLALIPLLTAVGSLFLGNFVYYLNPRLVMNRRFFYCCLSFTYIGFVEFAFIQSDSYETALFLSRIAVLWPFMVSILIHFVLVFIEKTKQLKKRHIFFLVYLPALLFSTLEFLGLPPIELIKVSWGWTYIYRVESIFYILETLWFYAASILLLYLAIRYYIKLTDKVKKVQARLLISGLTIPLLLTLVSGVIFPYLGIIIPDLTTTGLFIIIVFVGYGIRKYRLFILTLAVAAETILNTMADTLFLVTLQGEIISTNKAVWRLLRYQESELMGQHIDVIFTPNEKSKIKEIGVNQLMKVGFITDIETQFQTKTGGIIPISLSGALVREKKGKKQGIIYVGRDISERKKAENIIKESLIEKEILIKEIHHRVKNNLQLISSLLDLQLDRCQDPTVLNVFQDSKDRIRSMALVHENLYQFGDLARINGIEYIHNLVSYFFNTYGDQAGNITPVINIETQLLSLDMNTAIPFGLILTELLSNALKHAFPHGETGEVQITIRSETPDMVTLEVSDNGIGLPADLDFRETQSLGLQLVRVLTQQVKGAIEIDKSKGTAIILTFPYNLSYSQGNKGMLSKNL